ncbi:MAG: hypothetical protein KF721_15995 [Ignavibacteriaceae bacterium]|nr:hypothetical protein [Ignavibacteriaceae bacterium]
MSLSKEILDHIETLKKNKNLKVTVFEDGYSVVSAEISDREEKELEEATNNLYAKLKKEEEDFHKLPLERQKEILATRARFGEREAGITKAYEELEEEKRRRENEKKYW